MARNGETTRTKGPPEPSAHGPGERRQRVDRECMFCGLRASVLVAPNADDLDVEAEFASAGRAFGDEYETVGVGCYRCSQKRWSTRDQTHAEARRAER